MDNTERIPDDVYAARLQAGDESAFRYVMDRYFPIITHFALRIVANRAVAEDVAEETFIKLWQDHARVRNFQSIKAFLFITAKNGSLNERRSQQNQACKHRGFAADQADDGDRIDQEIIRAEVRAEILRTVDDLPEKMKRVFQLGFIEGMPNREIARVLDISVNTVKAQKSRALELVKEKLQGKDILPVAIALLNILAKINS